VIEKTKQPFNPASLGQNTTERFLAREILGVVEAAALAAGRLMGKGDKDVADQAAVTAMRNTMEDTPINGTIVIGEGERDEAPMLFIGEKVGKGGVDLPELDIAVDPLEGTNLVAHGLPGAVATLALAPKGGLFHAPDTYMNKLVVGPIAKGKIDINAPVKYNLSVIAMSLDRAIEDLTVVILDRARHKELICDVRSAGARIKLITDGDMMPAIASAISGSGIHAVMGTGGAPEAVLSAAAIKCLGGEIQGQIRWRNEGEQTRAKEMGITDTSEERVYETNELAPAEEIVFAACGITTGDILKGVQYFGGGARTHSVLMTYNTGLVRFVDTIHMNKSDPQPFKL
jgi:fructose-1,6-bisphosphatase II